MAPHERSKPLHNFSLPCLKWGNQRLLRCVKVTDEDDDDGADHHHHLHRSSSSSSIPIGFQSKPTNFHPSKNYKPTPVGGNPGSLNWVAKRLKLSPPDEEKRGGTNDLSRPWNLRTRRAACKAPLIKVEERRNLDFTRRNLEIHSPRKNEGLFFIKKDCGKEKMNEGILKFSVSLSKQEVEEDFMEMVRIRPSRRPKKRPRVVQKYLDSIFPGLWLTEITPDSYKVPEVPES